MNLKNMMSQIQGMQTKMQEMQDSLAEAEVTGTSGGGLVTATLDGKGVMKSVKIDSSLLKPEEVEIVEDLIVAAAQDAKGKAEALMQEKMKEVTGGLPIPPGMNLF
ncbi:MAG: YbaB/EbfC family nucleoid-associated protein [Hyphomicrobiaceae bacterium]